MLSPSPRICNLYRPDALLLFALLVTANGLALADDTPAFSREHIQFFENDVQPLLKKRCYKCHAGSKHKGELRLDYRGGLVEGGESGSSLDSEAPEESLFLSAIHFDAFEMPPTGKLPAAEIAIFAKWIKMNAPWRAGDDVPPKDEVRTGNQSPTVNAETMAFWSFQSVKKPTPPQSARTIPNPIDAFIYKRLDDAGLTATPRATKQTLIRRLYYDLTGLPPQPDEVKAFVEDASPKSYERLVDNLLQSPHYGERWGRHWLDLVRYAETNSYERDGAKPFVWRYRDYVIRSFNNDKPYDQFIREQLAGDELDEFSEDAIIATGYYRLGVWDDEPVDRLQAKYDDLDDILSTTGQVFLGLTIGCSRCHEHKLDPLPQEAYYSLLSFISNIRRYGERGNDSVMKASVQMVGPEENVKRYNTELAAWEKEIGETEAKLREIEKQVRPKLKGGLRDDFKRERVRLQVMRDLRGGIVSEEQYTSYRELFEKRDRLRRSQPKGLMQVLCVKEHGPTPKPTHVLVRGNAHAEAAEVQPEFPKVLGFAPPKLPEQSPFENSTGRRRVLADWIASGKNPLTARVMVNRIWQHHFGRGIVRSANDFGMKGAAPTLPHLLDWLAATFVEDGWRIKRLHKRILMSEAYQRSYSTDKKSVELDPLNHLLWRFDMRRLSAEEIRDSILAATGELRREKMFGPSIYSKIPAAVLAGQSRPGAGWGNSPPEERFRRSVYIHVKRSLVTPILSSYDFPEPDLSCPVRFVSTQPTQALGMLNSEFVGDQAKRWAERLEKGFGDDTNAIVAHVLARATQRTPTQAEIENGIQLVQKLTTQHKLTRSESLKQICLLALNLNEFVYLD